MNNKGQAIFVYFCLGIVIIILALAFAPILKQFVTDAMNPSTENSIGLDCNNASISDFDKANCVAVDLSQFTFIMTLISIGLAILVVWRFM